MASVRQAMFDSADQDDSGALDKYEMAKVIKDYYRPMHGHPDPHPDPSSRGVIQPLYRRRGIDQVFFKVQSEVHGA
jgi:hypothetical protein